MSALGPPESCAIGTTPTQTDRIYKASWHMNSVACSFNSNCIEVVNLATPSTMLLAQPNCAPHNLCSLLFNRHWGTMQKGKNRFLFFLHVQIIGRTKCVKVIEVNNIKKCVVWTKRGESLGLPAAMYSTMLMPKCSSSMVCRPPTAPASRLLSSSKGTLVQNWTQSCRPSSLQ